MAQKKVTISDIAKAAGVSKTTISRYLNHNYEYMSLDTRNNIERIIAEYHYVPNNVARTLKSKRSKLIGVVVNNLRYQVGAQTVTGINDVCSRNGYGTVVYCTEDDPVKEEQAIQLCLNQQMDGMVIIPCMESSTRYQELCKQGIPVMLCTRKLFDWPYGCAYVKHEEIIAQMLAHLKAQGFEKVRFLLDVNNFHKARMGNAFALECRRLFGMEPEESVILVGREKPKVPQALEDFMHDYPGARKAVMAVNTHTLFLTLKTLEEWKVRIPEDLGVCGYDAQGWSELVYPGITAIRQPMDQMGILAAQEIMASLKENRLTKHQYPLDCSVYYRRSTCIQCKATR